MEEWKATAPVPSRARAYSETVPIAGCRIRARRRPFAHRLRHGIPVASPRLQLEPELPDQWHEHTGVVSALVHPVPESRHDVQRL